MAGIIMYIIINNQDELNKFAKFYSKKHEVNLKKEYLDYYFAGRYYLPVVVKLNEYLKIRSHQGVKEEGQTWNQWREDNKSYDEWSPMSLETFLRNYGEK